MNLFDSCFLCLDLGTSNVRGIALHIQSGKLTRSESASCDSFDTVFAIKSVVDELEQKLNTHFESAYITGNFGHSVFKVVKKHNAWSGEHRITDTDIKNQISQIDVPDGFYPMHIIPLAYMTPGARELRSPIGFIDNDLISAFGIIFYENERLNEIRTQLQRAHIQSNGFFDPQYLQSMIYRKENTLFIDMGAEFTSASIWTNRGCVWHNKISDGMTAITLDISEHLEISFSEAERIKKNIACLIPHESDSCTPADPAYSFQRSDVNNIIIPRVIDIIGRIKDLAMPAINKYHPTKIILTGGGTMIDGVVDFFENAFGISGERLDLDATVNALYLYIWKLQEPKRQWFAKHQMRAINLREKIKKIFTKKHHSTKRRFLPILPSTMCFNMKRQDTYSMFNTGGISMLHIDIMDGLYVNNMTPGGVEIIKYINERTNVHLHVHLMTESPTAWSIDAIAAGADTVIVSTNTSGLKRALYEIKSHGKRCGVALNPDSPVALLKPILTKIDEVMVMAVAPGASGQSFNPDILHKISTLAALRKKYGLRFLISVDGGINNETAQMCWNAGADLLVSGSYLATTHDFPLAVQSLLKK